MHVCTPEEEKFRRLWWDQGNMHPKANWENAVLPYVLKTNVTAEEFIRRTDFFNVRGMWEWDDGTVRVYELPRAPHGTAVGALKGRVVLATGAVMGTNDGLIDMDTTTMVGRGLLKESDGCFRPKGKPNVPSPTGCDGNNQPWPNLVFEVAFSETLDHLMAKVKDFWLAPGRAHDVVAVKLEYVPGIPTQMTAWHFCTNTRDVNNDPVPLTVHEFGTIDNQGNPINLVLGQRVIDIPLACIYSGRLPGLQIPQVLPNPIRIDLFYVQDAVLSSWV